MWSRSPGEKEFLSTIAKQWKGASQNFEALVRLNSQFMRLPYENVSKILKAEQIGVDKDPRRLPIEVLHDHFEFGFGGTCFSLTAFMEDLLHLSGFAPIRILANTPAGNAHHSAVVVPIGSHLFLVDPGYLVGEPMLVPERVGHATRSGELELVRTSQNTITLYTVLPSGLRKLRYWFEIKHATEEEFVKRWIDSFNWPTARSVLITKREGGKIVYVRDFHLRIVSSGEPLQKENIRGRLGLIAREVFGLPPDAVEKALQIARARKRALRQLKHNETGK